MGSRGHAFISHTKALSPASQSKDGGYGSPPHPLTVRAGQRYWPRRGRKRRPFVVRRVADGRVKGTRLDGQQEPVMVSVDRLLARRDDGQGLHYQFQGFAARRYETFAQVIELEERMGVLCVPEWHPCRPVPIFTSLLPRASREPGAWLAPRCDLSAPSAARLELSALRSAEDPGPERIHRVDLGAKPAT